MKYLIDSHCHLNYEGLKEDIPQVLERARAAGVGRFLTISTRLTDVPFLQTIAQTQEDVFYTVGVHPHEATTYLTQRLPQDLQSLCAHPKVVGIGETGLDYHYTNSPVQDQVDSFCVHIQIAKALDLPLIIHTREADEDTLACLQGSNVRGVFHCFSGSASLAKAALDLGFYLSFSGIVTFKKADELRQIVSTIPLERILIETDSPFLAPVPHRGKVNEPAFVTYVAKEIARIKDVSIETITQATTANFYTLFTRVLP